ncbi:arginine--tRNA ligase [Candidatus Nomurabacteria bacterium]|nr:arginine--tRNA ligase [Candidatus Nomurabacteria bacterium]
MIIEKLEKELRLTLEKLSINVEKVSFEHPAELVHGDYSTNVAFIESKKLGKNPIELAKVIVEDLKQKNIPEIEKIEVAGPGFINFFLSRKFFTNSVEEILKKKDKYGRSKIGKGKRVVVEFSSPNIAKPFTVGHLRSTIIGDGIANILDFLGYKVIRDNHLGDWGTQFGKMIVALRRWGNEKQVEEKYSIIKKLVDLYVKFHSEAEKDEKLENEAREWFSRLEKGDKEAVSVWKKCVKWSIVEFNKIYKDLGIKFNTTLGESYFVNKVGDVVKEIKTAGIGKESEGAYLIFFPNEKYPPLMILKNDGSSIYAVRDLAADKFRLKKYGKDVTIVNEVGSEQSLYFKQLIETEKMLGWVKEGQRIHVGHGLYRFEEGKMSTRKGNVIWLEDILEEVIRKAGEINKETEKVVGIGALKFNDLKREPIKDIIFNLDEMVNVKGDSGPYLQYTYARVKSVILKAKGLKIKKSLKNIPENKFTLQKLIYRFPEIVERAGKEYSPNYLAVYLLELAGSFNNFYAENKIADKENINAPYFVALAEAVSIVLKNGLKLLGIQVVEKM